MRRLRTVLLAVAALACACGGGRTFREPKTVSDARPARTTHASNVALEDEAFRAAVPDRVAAKARALAEPTEVHLSNGIRVVMLERHDFPAISAVLVLDRGAAAAGPGVAELYAGAMTGTSAEYKGSEAHQYLTFVGATVNSSPWRDGIELEITALTPLFVSALSRGAPMFTSPAFDSDDLDESRTELAAARARQKDDPSDVASEALWSAVFPPPHPYGVPISGNRPRFAGSGPGGKPIANAEVRAFRDAYLSADHVAVACVGDFRPDGMQRLLEKALGALPRRSESRVAAAPLVAQTGGRKVLILDRPGAAQSAVAIGWPGPRAAAPEHVAVEVLGEAAAGGLSTRLNISVRKELGATYGVRMTASRLRDAGIIEITAAIETTRTVDAMRSLFAQLARLRVEPLADAELHAAKLRTYEDFGQGSTRGLAHHLADAMAEGLPVANAVTFNARVDLVTAESVRAVAERYLTPEEARVVIVGDAARLTEGLRSLGIGDVVVAREL